MRYYDGNISHEISIKDGYLNGKYVQYYATDQIYIERNYKNNQLHGEGIIYYKNGKIKLIEIYEHGKFVSKKEF